LLDHSHYASDEVRSILADMNARWTRLTALAAQRGDKLRQACEQRALDRTLDDAHAKMDEMERALQSKELGNDLRCVEIFF
jgi:spectrin beta